jgi:hypothetical protein
LIARFSIKKPPGKPHRRWPTGASAFFRRFNGAISWLRCPGPAPANKTVLQSTP